MALRQQANDTDKKIAAMLKKTRIQCGISQRDIAKLLNVTFQQVQKYESGGNRISAAQLFNVCEYIGADIDKFFYDVASMPTPDRRTIESLKFYALASRLGRVEYNVLVCVLRAMAEK